MWSALREGCRLSVHSPTSLAQRFRSPNNILQEQVCTHERGRFAWRPCSTCVSRRWLRLLWRERGRCFWYIRKTPKILPLRFPPGRHQQMSNRGKATNCKFMTSTSPAGGCLCKRVACAGKYLPSSLVVVDDAEYKRGEIRGVWTLLPVLVVVFGDGIRTVVGFCGRSGLGFGVGFSAGFAQERERGSESRKIFCSPGVSQQVRGLKRLCHKACKILCWHNTAGLFFQDLHLRLFARASSTRPQRSWGTQGVRPTERAISDRSNLSTCSLKEESDAGACVGASVHTEHIQQQPPCQQMHLWTTSLAQNSFWISPSTSLYHVHNTFFSLNRSHHESIGP